METAYKTLERELRCEIDKIKGSRFIATAGPLGTEAELGLRIEALRAEFPEASHHCYAWRDGSRFRYSDDGEPSGTAGRPILQQIDGKHLDRVSCVVTRIFGGTKLGAGGLVRAYSGAAGEVLHPDGIVTVVPTQTVRITIPYELSGALKSIANARGLEPTSSDFAVDVTQTFEVVYAEVEAFVDEVRERTAGRAAIEIAGERAEP